MWFYIFLAICIVMLSMFIKRNPGSFKLVDDAKTDSSGDEIKINPGDFTSTSGKDLLDSLNSRAYMVYCEKASK